jgi:hypothetical protein
MSAVANTDTEVKLDEVSKLLDEVKLDTSIKSIVSDNKSVISDNKLEAKYKAAMKRAAKNNNPAEAFRRHYVDAVQTITTDEIKLTITDEDNIVYVCFRHRADPLDRSGCVDPLIGGVYIFEFSPSSNFPFDPPMFKLLTPNGVYGVGRQPCIEIGMYHHADYPSGMGLGMFIMNTIGGLICPDTLGHGIEILSTSVLERQKLAKESEEYNRKHLIDNHYIRDLLSQFSD